MMRITRIALCSVVVATLACAREGSTPLPPQGSLRSSDGVSAERVEGGVRLANGSSASILYVVWDENSLALLGSCLGQSGCPRLDPGKTVTVREDNQTFSGVGNTAVYWCVVGQATDEPKKLIVPGGR